MVVDAPSPSLRAPPRQDPAAKLMVLLARDRLDAVTMVLARNYIGQVSDWWEFLTLAHRNNSLPFIHHHLHNLDEAALPQEALEAMKGLTRAKTLSNLKRQAALISFHDTCLAPIEAAYCFVKGPALAAKYYAEPGLRSSVDIDVLVAEHDYQAVADLALRNGYKIAIGFAPFEIASDRQDIDFLIRRSDCLSLFNAEMQHFELHRHIEKSTPIFPENEVIATRSAVAIGRQPVYAMNTDWLFCYICYHHSRHFWSRLHWVADMHALMAHPSFDRTRAMQLAARIGIRPTVEASIEFAYLTNQPEDWISALQGGSHGAKFLDACLRGLPGDSAFEVEQWGQMFLFDFQDDWQLDRGWKAKLWAKSALRRLTPTLTQYLKNRRPRWLEPLYFAENALALSSNLMKRVAGKP